MSVRAAVQIGRRLAKLAHTHQVIVVTHLPQVAAFADIHLTVDRVNSKGSGVRRLDDEAGSPNLPGCLPGSGTPTPAGRMPASYSTPPAPSAPSPHPRNPHYLRIRAARCLKPGVLE